MQLKECLLQSLTRIIICWIFLRTFSWITDTHLEMSNIEKYPSAFVWTNDIFRLFLLMFRHHSACEFTAAVIHFYKSRLTVIMIIEYSKVKLSHTSYRSEVILKRYAGCLRDIEISRTPYNLLSSSDYTGVTKGCNVEVSELLWNIPYDCWPSCCSIIYFRFAIYIQRCVNASGRRICTHN